MRTFDDCCQHLTKLVSYSEATTVVRNWMNANPRLFVEATIWKQLRQQPCGIYTLDKSKVGLINIGRVGFVFSNRLDATDDGIQWIMSGGIFVVRTDVVFQLSEKLTSMGARLVEIAYAH